MKGGTSIHIIVSISYAVFLAVHPTEFHITRKPVSSLDGNLNIKSGIVLFFAQNVGDSGPGSAHSILPKALLGLVIVDHVNNFR